MYGWVEQRSKQRLYSPDITAVSWTFQSKFCIIIFLVSIISFGGNLTHSHKPVARTVTTEHFRVAMATYQGQWSEKCCGCDGCQRWPPPAHWGWSVSSCCRHPLCPVLCLIGCRRCAPGCRFLRSRWSSWACCDLPIANDDWRQREDGEWHRDVVWWRGDVMRSLYCTFILAECKNNVEWWMVVIITLWV